MSMPLNIQDWRTLAQKQLPQFAFDFIDGAAEDNITLKANRQAFEKIHLLPRVLRDTRVMDTSVQILGSHWSAPLGIAPMGLNGLVRPRGDTLLAKAAEAAGVPFVLSTASNDRLEHVRKHAPSANLWLQLYVMQDPGITDQLLRRAKAHGFDTLVLTVDVPVSGHRELDHRNGFRVPFRLTPRLLADLVAHPRWSLQQAVAGPPAFVNLVEDLSTALSPQAQAALLARAMDRGLNWERLDEIRQKWPGKLLLKGVLHPDDASLAVKAGVDGIVVSNHGGRQLDGASPSLDALPTIHRAVSGRIPILLDSGIRRGVDIVKALALGASGVLIGRPLLYGLATAGESGARKVLRTLEEELQRSMVLLGVTSISDIDARCLA